MSNLIPYLPTDESGKSPTNLVTNEERLVLEVEDVKYPVVVLENGGFFTPELQVRDKNFKLLDPKIDYVATHKYADASAYTGIEICGAIVLLNPAVKDVVYVTAQMVGGDLAFNLNAREDTLSYLRGLGTTLPIWSGFMGEEPMWQDGELRRDRWSLKGVESFIFELTNIGRSLREGDPLAENAARAEFLAKYNDFMDSFSNDLANHLRDENNPHADTKFDVDLGNVQNLPLATPAIAQAGESGGHYLSPALFRVEINTLAVPVLDAHVKNKNNPHRTTAAQAKTYTKPEFDTKVAERLGLSANADNTLRVDGFNYSELFTRVRAGLDAQQFVGGRFGVDQLGIGNVPGVESILLASGRWMSLQDIFDRYQSGGSTTFIYMGVTSNQATMLNTVRTLYADVQRYPVGTMVFYRFNYYVNYGQGNGVGGTTLQSVRAIIRTASDWIIIS